MLKAKVQQNNSRQPSSPEFNTNKHNQTNSNINNQTPLPKTPSNHKQSIISPSNIITMIIALAVGYFSGHTITQKSINQYHAIKQVQFRENITGLNQVNDELRANYTSLHLQYIKYQSSLQVLEVQNQQLKNVRESMKNYTDLKEQITEKLNKQVQELKNKARQTDLEKRMLLGKINTYWNQNLQLGNMAQILQDRVQNMKKNISNTQDNQKKITQHLKKIQQLQKRTNQLELYKQTINQQNVQLSSSKNNLQSQLQRLKLGNRQIELAVQSLTQQKVSLQLGNKQLGETVGQLTQQKMALTQRVGQLSKKAGYLAEKNRLLQLTRMRLISIQSDLINLKVQLNENPSTQQNKNYQQLLMAKFAQSQSSNPQKMQQKTFQQVIAQPNMQGVIKGQAKQAESPPKPTKPSQEQASIPTIPPSQPVHSNQHLNLNFQQNQQLINQYLVTMFVTQEQIQKRYNKITPETVSYWKDKYKIILSTQNYRLGHLQHEFKRAEFYQMIKWNHVQDADFSNTKTDDKMWKLISESAPGRFDNLKQIGHNMITSVKQIDFQKFKSLRFISLENNPLSEQSINQLNRYKSAHPDVQIKFPVLVNKPQNQARQPDNRQRNRRGRR